MPEERVHGLLLQRGIIDDGTRPRGDLYRARGAKRLVDMLADAAHLRDGEIRVLLGEGAHDAREFGAVGQNIIGVAGAHLADGHHTGAARVDPATHDGDRKSTRLNSSHVRISYAVFCLKKKNENKHHINLEIYT